MELYMGLDIAQESPHLSVVDSNGREVWQGKCPTTPAAITAKVQEKASGKIAKIGLESGPLSNWLWHELKGLGLPVVCLDARHAKAALAMQINKSDRNDALGLAQIVRMGWYREVRVKAMDNHRIRAVLGARAQLVGMKTDVTNQLRGMLKNFGDVQGKGKLQVKNFDHYAEGNDLLAHTVRALAGVLQTLNDQIIKLNSQMETLAKNDALCRLLMTIPGVGPITAAAFVAAVDDPARFRKSRSVAAYLGLTPRRYQSGDIDLSGRISKCGDSLVRSYLYEAAGTLLTRAKAWSALKAWGLKIARRGGARKAKVAVARKLAVIMHRMLCTGETFRWSSETQEVAA
jgi:transposase